MAVCANTGLYLNSLLSRILRNRAASLYVFYFRFLYFNDVLVPVNGVSKILFYTSILNFEIVAYIKTEQSPGFFSFKPQHKRRKSDYQWPKIPISLQWYIVVYVSNELGFNIIWPGLPFIFSWNKTNLNQHSDIFIHLGYRLFAETAFLPFAYIFLF